MLKDPLRSGLISGVANDYVGVCEHVRIPYIYTARYCSHQTLVILLKESQTDGGNGPDLVHLS